MYKKVEDMKITDCQFCTDRECVHRNSYRRLSVLVGGLGLCKKLKNKSAPLHKFNVKYTLNEKYKFQCTIEADEESQLKELLLAKHNEGIVVIDEITKGV